VSVGFLPLLVIIALGVAYFARHRDSASRARFLRRAGFGLMAFITSFFMLFVVGDPGGWRAAALIARWLVPLAALAALSWYRRDSATGELVTLTVAAVGLGPVWAAADSGTWRSFEDRNGPIRTIATFVLAAAVACWA